MQHPVEASAYARVGLLGNPSDGYGGKAIAFSLGNFRATVTIETCEGFEIASPGGERSAWSDFDAFAAPLDPHEGGDGERLLRAALRRFVLRFPELASAPASGMRIAYRTDIPREVGLSGSSAIIMACLRALLCYFERQLDADALATLALTTETDELGIAAGPMDRIIQARQGLLWMDFAPLLRGEAPLHRQLEGVELPEMFVAWDPRGGEASGLVHSDIRSRYERGDADVREAMATFPKLVDAGVDALEAGDHDAFAELVDRNFDTRAAIWNLAERDRELVAIGRRHGWAVKQTGSGGAVVGVRRGEASFAAASAEYEAAGYAIIRPQLVGPREAERFEAEPGEAARR